MDNVYMAKTPEELENLIRQLKIMKNISDDKTLAESYVAEMKLLLSRKEKLLREREGA
ncbi:MAG: hypothetical protein LBC56_06230 [Oscillospiraceae bacterium]|nr:hypothetical protein [Oscillospiraceae bacterium]